MKKHIFPKTVRNQIIISTAAITLIIAAITVTICFSVFQSFLRKAEIQSAEFNMQVISNNVSADMDHIFSFVDWCSSNTDINHFLRAFQNQEKMPTISSEDFSLRTVALNTYSRLKEQYNDTPSSEKYMSRVLISPENRKVYLQLSDTSATNTSSAADIVYADEHFQRLLNAPEYLWNGLHPDPLLESDSPKFLPIVRPIYNQYNADRIGWLYLTIPERLLTDYIHTLPLEEDSALYVTIGEHTYRYNCGQLTECDFSFQILKDVSSQTFHKSNHAAQVQFPDGSRRYTVSCPLGNQGWTITQVLSDQSYLAQRDVYNIIIGGIVVVILISGGLLYLVLSHLINRPVALLQSKIGAIAQGDFSRDPSIEWKNEFGTIGKGINQMSENVVSLMDKKVEDEKQKKDLEYQILQSQINPHFLYNTLNSIKWMATIQGAGGIAEMTTALARLMKNVSKGTGAQIPLKDELALVQDYFLIQQYRYGGSVSLECRIPDPELYHCMIHRFSLQPIVENALFHGIEPKGCAGKIVIEAWESSASDGQSLLKVSVTDNGIGMTEETMKKVLTGEANSSTEFFRHVGINNVNKRIQYDFGEDFGITIQSETGENSYTVMTITLPYITDERTTIL